MRKSVVGVVGLTAVVVLTLGACGGDDDSSPSATGSSSAVAGKVGVILPDSASSARWETADRKYLSEAFAAAGVEFDIQNAQ
ncbi:MAG: sugar ABC transporter substrate-binding protein, partial [Actinomycetales bacterium]|nr:sugar ABC transporter substrate-binding protein [Actinomycetales bacterium]